MLEGSRVLRAAPASADEEDVGFYKLPPPAPRSLLVPLARALLFWPFAGSVILIFGGLPGPGHAGCLGCSFHHIDGARGPSPARVWSVILQLLFLVADNSFAGEPHFALLWPMGFYALPPPAPTRLPVPAAGCTCR